MKLRSFLCLAVASTLAIGVAAGCGSSTGTATGTALGVKGPAIEKIQKRGKLLIGAKHDVPKFGFKDEKSGKVDGYEIDLARRLAKAILGDENKFETTHVTAKTRVGLLDSGEIDVIIATMTVTEQRKTEVDFSPVYYTDGIGMLVLKDGGIKGLKDMNGKTLGVVKGATTGPRMQEQAKKLSIDLKLAEFDTYPEIKAALGAGRVQAMSTDGAILAGYTDDKTILLPERYSEEPYGIATKKGNDDLRQVVEKVITDLEKSGELKTLQDKWGIGVKK